MRWCSSPCSVVLSPTDTLPSPSARTLKSWSMHDRKVLAIITVRLRWCVMRSICAAFSGAKPAAVRVQRRVTTTQRRTTTTQRHEPSWSNRGGSDCTMTTIDTNFSHATRISVLVTTMASIVMSVCTQRRSTQRAAMMRQDQASLVTATRTRMQNTPAARCPVPCTQG